MSKKVDVKLDGLFDLDVEDGSFIEVETTDSDSGIVDFTETNPFGQF